jgi:hypothetical protein
LNAGPFWHLGTRILATFALLAATSGCDDRDARKPQQSAQPATVPTSLDGRLLGSPDSRRQWPGTAEKIWLKNPTVALDVKATDGKPVRLHARGENENDYNSAMTRLNEGAVLYAITQAEFEELRTRAAAAQVP